MTDFYPEMKLNSQSVLKPLTADVSHAPFSPTSMAEVAPSPYILPTQWTHAFWHLRCSCSNPQETVEKFTILILQYIFCTIILVCINSRT